MRKLLEWLKSLLRRTPHDTFDIYRPHERLIYHYFDGHKVVHVDPMLLYRKVMDKGPELDADIKLAGSPSRAASKGHEAMLKKIRDIFSVEPFEKGGLTESETTGLLDHFLLYCDSLKKNAKPPQTPPEETSGPTGPSSPAPRPTPSSSDSGSTATAPPSDSPEPSNSVSASPSAGSIPG